MSGMRFAALCVSIVACAACQTPAKETKGASSAYAPAPDPKEGPPREMVAAQKPWTSEFKQPGLLIAAEIRIEGPEGLLEHVATTQDPFAYERVEKTVPDGFLQQITMRPDAGAGEIKAQLDQVVIVATQRLSVLERPVPCDVVVQAMGDVFWSQQGMPQEQRAPTLRLVGRIER